METKSAPKSWLSDEQVQTLNERHGWFQFGDAQSDVSRQFAHDAIEMHERVRAAAPKLLDIAIRVDAAYRNGELINCNDAALLSAVIAEATGSN